jgi:hypothetical protein
MATGKFGTLINCIDGRSLIPVVTWLKEKYDLDYIDTVTEPGVDKIMSNKDDEKTTQIKKKALISKRAHSSSLIAIAGHHDCAGNPVSKEEHIEQIKKSVETIKSWNYQSKIVGIWVNEHWQVEHINSAEISRND